MMAKKLNDITAEIVDASLKVHRALGPGLYERVYEDCLSHELAKRKINLKRQEPVTVEYDDLIISGAFKMDLLIEDKVVVELKSTDKILPIHESQILTYMRLARKDIGLLINFNVPLIKDGIKRFKI